MWASVKQLGLILDRTDRRKLVELLVVVTGMVVLELLGIFSIVPFMKFVSQPEALDTHPWIQWFSGWTGLSSRRSLLTSLGVGLLVMYSLSTVANIIGIWVMQKTIWGIGHRISVRLVKRYTQLPTQYFLTHDSSDMVRKIVSDTRALVGGVLMAGSQCLANAFRALMILLMLFVVNPLAAGCAFILYGSAYVVIHFARHNVLERLGRERLATISVRLKTFTETLSGIPHPTGDRHDSLVRQSFRAGVTSLLTLATEVPVVWTVSQVRH